MAFPGAARPILASSLLPPDHDAKITASSLDEDEWRLGPEIYGDDALEKPAAALVSAGHIMGISSLIPQLDYNGPMPGDGGGVREWVDEASEFGQILSAVDQVSDLLFKIEQQQHGTENKNNSSDVEQEISGSPASQTKVQLENDHEKEDGNEAPILLLIEGMDLALRETIRASDVDGAGAQLSAFLRTLTLLCQTYNALLTIIIVNSIPLRPQPPMSLQLSAEELHAQLRAGTTLVETPLTSPYRIEDMETPVESVFDTPPDPRLMKASPYPSNQHLSLLADVIGEGIDIHLVVSKVENERIIEVVKDRVGDNLGRWDVF
ncbi:uncharacterized protein GIQ15_01246 [Arthroderma uncinatum]|uniref:uncharacterized protein n=1 Tax=Arthroderma uncinatum TaxID=74035 RepID=UPI00144AC78F|nr:uncharacterized protein GIQ15_01246 [Arthroderma uncinatum]KAF3491729.1 hypothetical protein GIQ15_01246 [Arthroderma uncinatum]